MTKKEIIEEIFTACMQEVNVVFELRNTDESHNPDLQEFHRLLVKNDLDKFSDHLQKFFQDVIKNNEHRSSYIKKMDQDLINSENFRYEILKTLRFLLKNQKSRTLTIGLSKAKEPYIIRNETLISHIEEFIQKLFSDIYKETITNENLDRLISEYESLFIRRTGAPNKNLYLYILTSELGDLVRINRFLNSTKDVEFEQIKLTNKDFRFIYECLSFWGFITERQENTSTPDKYLRTLLKQTKKLPPVNVDSHRHERILELKTIMASLTADPN